MAKLPHANSKRMYSWWWDSHISPKNSRWLQENLTDMDVKVKSMIKLIEEDADSFARRAEMYYKKRPELMKMVEEFYRAYRALAERYDQSTRALLQASRTMTESLPNQVPSGLTEDELARFVNEKDFQTTDDQYSNDRKGVKQFNNSFGSEDDGKVGRERVRKGLNFDEAEEKEDKSIKSAVKLEKEIQTLRETLAKFEAEKESSLAHYKHSLEKLSHQNLGFSNVQEDTKKTKVEDEVESLKITIKKLEDENGTTLSQYQKCLEKIEYMEGIISRGEKHVMELNERAQKAEAEALTLKLDLATMESEKTTSLDQCKQSSEKISDLKNKLVLAEDEAKKLNERAEKAETEAKILKKALAKLGVEKEANAVQYRQCLDTISNLQNKISCAQEEVHMLNGKLESGDAKLKGSEEKCILLEKSNQSLYSELESLKLKIGVQNEELGEKEREMGILWTSVQEESFRFVEAETAFQTLQLLHAQTEEELKSLALELQNRSQIVSDLETRNQSLLAECVKIKEENESLNNINFTSLLSIKDMQNEIKSLLETKRKLEEEVELRVDQRNALQHDIYCLKEELRDLNKKYLGILDQVEAVGFNPECFQSAVKGLQDENLNLNKIREKEMREKLHLLGKVENLEKVVEKDVLLEKSIADLSADLEGARLEIISLLETKGNLEEEVKLQVDQSNAFQQDIYCLKEELNDLNKKYLAMLDQVDAVGFNPECFQSAVKGLQDENLKFKETEEKEMRDKLVLLGKVENLEKVVEKNALLEKSNADLSADLEGARVEIISLLESKGRLEEEVALRMDQSNALQQDIYRIKEELNDLNKKYLAMLDQVEAVGFNPECFQSAVKGLQDENINLKETEEKEMREKLDLLWKVENLEKEVEKNALLEKSLAGLSADLEESRKEILALDQSFISVSKEKSTLDSEKAAIMTQLQVATEDLVKLSEKNTFMENSVTDAHDEIEGLKIRLNSFEQSCQILEIEKSYLINEKVALVSQVEITRQILEDLEKKYRVLEEKYSVLEKEKESALCEVIELQLKVKESKHKEEKHMIEAVEKNAFLEKSLSDLSAALGVSRKEILALEKSFKSVSEEKSTLDLEKAAIVTQLEVATENLMKLSEENIFIENSVSDAQDQIEGLNMRLKSLQEVCQILENEKSDLISEKVTLVSQLKITRQRLEDLEKNYQGLEEKYSVLEKEKEYALCEVAELELTVKENKQKEEKQMIEIENLHGNVFDMQKLCVTLKEENSKLLDEKISLVKNLVDFQEKNNTLEGENLLILGETASLSYLSVIFKNIISEKSLEIEELRSTVDKLQRVSVGFEGKISAMEGKLEQAQFDNMDLNKLLKKTEDNVSAITLVNSQLYFEIENGKDLLCQKETEISEANGKVAYTENEKLELQNIVAGLKEKYGEIKIFWDESNRKRNNEVVLWESEATKLTSELHSSSVILVLLEEKFWELNVVLESLEEETNSKDRGIDLLTEKINILKNENGEIGARLAEYSPAINSLKDCISSLENRISLHKELQNGYHEIVEVGTEEQVKINKESNTNQKETDILSDLQDLETRVKAVEITVIETNSKLEAATKQIKELASKSASNPEKVKPASVNSKLENGLLTKDTMLDQISEISSYGIGREEGINADIADLNENGKFTKLNEEGVDFDFAVTVEKELGVDKPAISKIFSLPNQELDKTKILERLNSDSQKLANLQTTVQDLKWKAEMSEKRLDGKSIGSKSVGEQLVKAEENIMQLSDVNGKLMKNVDNSDDVKCVVESEENRSLRRKFSEQARKMSERIGQLQLEVQKIQFIMLKIDGENMKDKNERRSKFIDTKRTSLSDYLGRRTSNRKKKRVFCGCVHSPSTEE